MGLTIEESLRLPGLAGTSVAAGASGLSRVVRHMVVDSPTDPLAAAGPDVLVVLGARLPPADPANCRALVERLDSMGTAALAFRRTEGPAPVPGEVLAEADRRGLPVLALPPGVRLDEIVSEVPEGFGSTEEFTRLMARKPAWALELPIAASTWTGPRYCK